MSQQFVHLVLTAVSSFIIAFHCQVSGSTFKNGRTNAGGLNSKISSREYLITLPKQEKLSHY